MNLQNYKGMGQWQAPHRNMFLLGGQTPGEYQSFCSRFKLQHKGFHKSKCSNYSTRVSHHKSTSVFHEESKFSRCSTRFPRKVLSLQIFNLQHKGFFDKSNCSRSSTRAIRVHIIRPNFQVAAQSQNNTQAHQVHLKMYKCLMQ